MEENGNIMSGGIWVPTEKVGFLYSLIPSFDSLRESETIFCPRPAVEGVLGEENWRGNRDLKHSDHSGYNVFLLQHHFGSHHGYGLHGMLPPRSSFAMGGNPEQIF